MQMLCKKNLIFISYGLLTIYFKEHQNSSNVKKFNFTTHKISSVHKQPRIESDAKRKMSSEKLLVID